MAAAQDPDPTGGPRRLVVGAAIVDDLARPSRLLAARRVEPAYLRGGWEFPGGKVEPDETPVQAVHRELREELGIEVELGSPLPGPQPDLTWPLSERYAIRVFFARVVSGQVRPLEDHDELRWLARDELFDVPWLPADLPIVTAVAARMVRRAGPG